MYHINAGRNQLTMLLNNISHTTNKEPELDRLRRPKLQLDLSTYSCYHKRLELFLD